METERRPEAGQSSESLLAREFVEVVLSGATDNLERDGSVMPVLFLNLGGERAIVSLTLPDTHAARAAYFTDIGLALHQRGKTIKEAMFVSEVWYVGQNRLRLDLAPSQHPQRKEAIVIVGRNADRTRFTSVIQPFSRDPGNQPVFEPLAVAEYNVSAKAGTRPVGLVDYLFPPRVSGRRRQRVIN